MAMIKEIVEKMELFIPGLKGYKQKELLREEDLGVRRKLEEFLNSATHHLREAEQAIAMSGGDPTLFEEKVVQRIELLRSWISSAESGFGGLFDKVNIEEPQLEAILQNDLQMLETAKELSEKAKELSTTLDTQKIFSAASELSEIIEKIRSLAEKRKQILLGGE